MNQVILKGQIKDIKLGSTGKTNYCRCTVVTERQTGGNVYKEYNKAIAWGDKAYAMEQLRDGDQVLVIGKIGTRKYEDKDGNTKYATEVTAFSIYQEVTVDVARGDAEEIPF